MDASHSTCRVDASSPSLSFRHFFEDVEARQKGTVLTPRALCSPSVGCITRILSVRWDGRSLGCRQTPCQAAMSQSIAGEYDSRKDHCGCGYEAVWSITENGNEIIVQEQPG
ncbi:MAG: hypothetical protein ACPIOQ_43575 [Promethearchaeia archaeon]